MKTTKEEIKQKAEKVAAYFGYNTSSLSLDVINVKDSYCMGFRDGVKEMDKKSITGNEPAYQSIHDPSGLEQAVHTGLTIRQHFAVMAMNGLLCNARIVTGIKDTTISVPALSESACHYADNLIAELNKSQDNQP